MTFHRTTQTPFPEQREVGFGAILLLGMLCCATGIAWMVVAVSVKRIGAIGDYSCQRRWPIPCISLPEVSSNPESVVIFNATIKVLIFAILTLAAYLVAESFLHARQGVIPGITSQ